MNEIPRRESILVVDDTRSNLHFLVETLTREGYAVRPAPDGQLAVAAAQADPPDLILLDILMPGMDGYEVCEALKASAQTRDIPVIFLSALDELLDKVKAFSLGGVDYITKPFQVEEVLARVQTHLALRRLQKDLTERNIQLEMEILERKRSEQVLQRYTERLEIQHEIELSILAARMPETIAMAAISRLRNLIPYSQVIVLAVGAGGRPKMLAAKSHGDTGPRLDETIYQEVLQEPVLNRGLVQGIPDLAAMAHRRSIFQEAMYASGIRSYAIVPLYVQNVLLGTLHLESDRPRAFSAEHIAIATEVAVSLAVAIQQASLSKRDTGAVTDEL